MRALLTVFICLLAMAAAAQTKVYLVPVLHGMHKTNIFYTYDSLQAIIERTGADVVAVEIRPEDIAQDSQYLKKNYPYEMWMMPHWFMQKKVEGFDWLGRDIEGKQIPDTYWQQGSEAKRLQSLLAKDSVYTGKLKSCHLYTTERMKILSSLPLKEILTSNDAILTKEYYNCLQQHLRGSDYEYLTGFYNTRNQKIIQNLDAIFNRHKDKTIVILTGADHYPYVLDHLKKTGAPIAKLY